MDSLVAVEIRAWFLQELAVDLPVLKILGGASVTDLVDYSMQKLHDVLSANAPPSATNSTSVSYSQEVPGQSSRMSVSASSSDYMVDSASSSIDIIEDLEAPLAEVGDSLNQALANEKGNGKRVENATLK